MLFWAVVFLVISIISGALGLTGVAGFTMDVAQFLVGAFLVLALIFFGLAIWGGKKVSNLFS